MTLMDEKTVSYDAVETKNNKKRKACEKNSLFQVYTVDAFLNNLKKEESERKALKKFCEQAPLKPSKFAREDRNVQECANLCFNTRDFNVRVKYQDCSFSYQIWF